MLLRRAMTRDPEKYVNPEDFNPDRFLDENGKLNDDDVGFTFGFGRRYVSLSLSKLFSVLIGCICNLQNLSRTSSGIRNSAYQINASQWIDSQC